MKCYDLFIFGLFGSLERGEGRGVEGRRVEENDSLYLIWMFFKISKGEGSNYPSPCWDVLKITMKMRENY